MKLLKFIVVVAIVASAPIARADTTPVEQGVSTYVSAQFKTIAKRTFEQLAVKTLEGACPKGQPICKAIVDRLGQALIAAVEKDSSGLRDALNGFFVDSSIDGVLQLALGDLLEKKSNGAVQQVVAPLATCLASYITQKRAPQDCLLADAKALLTDKLGITIGDSATPCANADCPYLRAFVQAIKAGHSPSATAVLHVLAAVASSKFVHRADLRVYIVGLDRFLNSGPGVEGGLFEATIAYLKLPPEDGDVAIRSLTLDGPAAVAIRSALMDATQDGTWGIPADCKAATEAFGKWQAVRDVGHFEANARQAILTRGALDITALETLSKVDCPDPNALAVLHDGTNFLLGPLEIRKLLLHPVELLAAAAIIDFVRFNDEARLDRAVLQIVSFGFEAEARAKLGTTVTSANLEDFLKLRICETEDLQHLLTFTVKPAVPEHCLSVNTGVAGMTQLVPGLTVEPPTPAIEAARAVLVQATIKLLTDKLAATVPVLDPVIEAVPLADLSKTLVYITDGNKKAARKVVLRFGITLLVDEVDRLTIQLLKANSIVCEQALKRTSIFYGPGAACAAQVLIQSAYYPIADYLWDTGINSGNVSTVATKTYQSLLQNKALDHTPIILNLGLGGDLVFGHQDVWGSGLAALTVVDKFGLAFFKRTEQNWTFEHGPFVGGFLDALVRTATGDGKDHRNWLAGYTIGFPRMAGVDLGVELHVAAALPYEIHAHEVGFAVGLTLVVPFSTLFQTGK